MRTIFFVRLALIAAFALVTAGAYAQLPGIGLKGIAGKPAPVAKEGAQESDSTAALRTSLAQVQAELARVDASPNQALNAPADTPAGQILLRQTLLAGLVRNYQQHLDDIAALEKLRERRDTVEERLARWRLDESSGAFSMLDVEALRREVQLKLRQIETIAARLDSVDVQIEGARNIANRADQQARRLLERIERRDAQAARLVWERDLQLLRARAATVAVDSLTH